MSDLVIAGILLELAAILGAFLFGFEKGYKAAKHARARERMEPK